MDHYLPNPAEAATLTIYLGYAYAKEKETKLTRFRISSRTLRSISRRSALREPFLNDWEIELNYKGWKVIPDGDHFGLIRADAIDGWPRISSKRIAGDLEGMNDSTIKRIGRKLPR
jgi:hypothetical protein